MRAYVREMAPALKAERAQRIQDAKAKVESLATADMPLTREEWTSWFLATADDFRAAMRTATKDRRGLSRRVAARENVPEAKSRINPVQKRIKAPTDGWPAILWGRCGWHSLQRLGGANLLLFLSHYHGQTYYIDFHRHREGAWFLCKGDFQVDSALRPLADLMDQVPNDAVGGVYEIAVDGDASASGSKVRARHALLLTAPLARPPKRSTGEDAAVGSDDSDCSAESASALDSSDENSSVDRYPLLAEFCDILAPLG